MSGAAILAGVAILAAILFAVGRLVFDAVRQHETAGRTGRGDAEVGLITLARLLAPVWLLLVVATLWLLTLVFLALNQADAGTDPLAIRWTVLGFVGLVTALGALVSAPLALIRVQTTERQTRTAEQGHMTDRISHAVEQLGSEKTVKRDGKAERTVPNIEVRIGAILSLERIAQDSTTYDRGRDHVRVMEILCAYIRENAPATGARDFPLPEWKPLPDDATEAQRRAHEEVRKVRFGDRPNAKEWAQSLAPPRAEIAMALDVLGRRTPQQRRVEAAWPEAPGESTVWPFDMPCPTMPETDDDKLRDPARIAAFRSKLVEWTESLRAYRGYRLDLRGANLQGAALSARHPGSYDAVFSAARLEDARMEGAVLWGARMEGAVLWGARMEGANLREAQMAGTDLQQARMEVAFLLQARMEGAFLLEARMEGADLTLVQMEGAKLWGARMAAARLRGAWMEGAFLSGARMEGADLRGARMDSRTSLSVATLRVAALRQVDYSDATISDDQIKSAFGDASVTLPAGMSRPDHWPEWELPDGDAHAYDAEWRKWRDDPEGYTPPPPPPGDG